MKNIQTMKNLNTLPIALVATFCLLLFSFNSSAQSVGINATGATPDGSALLDLSAPNKGFLITRADTAAISSPAFGLMTLSPSDSCLYMQNGETSGKTWISIGGVGVDCPCTSSQTQPPSFSCGSPFTDTRDSKTYGTVQIGNQCWMRENLNYTPTSGNSECLLGDATNCTTYGRLYDWDGAMNGGSSSGTNPSGVQGVCPTGWHLPSDAEWKELEMYLGMSQADADGINSRGTNEGDALKTSSWGGNNSSGFTALPGGAGMFPSGAMNAYVDGYWWSATESGTVALRRGLITSSSGVRRDPADKNWGCSVRCVRN